MWTDFLNSFTNWFIGKFSMHTPQRFPSHLHCVALLPCEVWKSRNVADFTRLRKLLSNIKGYIFWRHSVGKMLLHFTWQSIWLWAPVYHGDDDDDDDDATDRWWRRHRSVDWQVLMCWCQSVPQDTRSSSAEPSATLPSVDGRHRTPRQSLSQHKQTVHPLHHPATADEVLFFVEVLCLFVLTYLCLVL